MYLLSFSSSLHWVSKKQMGPKSPQPPPQHSPLLTVILPTTSFTIISPSQTENRPSFACLLAVQCMRQRMRVAWCLEIQLRPHLAASVILETLAYKPEGVSASLLVWLGVAVFDSMMRTGWKAASLEDWHWFDVGIWELLHFSLAVSWDGTLVG